MSNSVDEPNACTMGVMEHLTELRKRLFFSAITILVGAIVSYYFSSEVFALLSAPYTQSFANAPLVGTSPAEAWVLKVKVAIFCGALIMSPVLFYQLWAFVAPGLYPNERRWVVPFVLASSLLLIGGAAFCYMTALPLALSFFRQEFLSINVTPTIKIGEYISMAVVSLLGFGIVFEMPLVTLILARAGIIDHHFLVSWYRQAILIIFIIAAIITPPDVLSQMLLAVPLLILYVISIGIAYLCSRRNVSSLPTEAPTNTPTAGQAPY